MRARGSLQTRALLIWAGMLCAVLTALGNYSVAQARSTGETDDQTALAVPRIELRGAAGVGLPQPLSPSQSALIRRIFMLQGAGSIADAVRETSRLESDLLLGTILADRYLRASYRTTATELTDWLARFGDQPEATAIRDLLERMAPGVAVPGMGTDAGADRTVSKGRRAVRPSQVRSLFVDNHDAAAVTAAQPLLARASEPAAAEALFVAGLAAMRLDQSDTAYAFFDSAYHAAALSSLRAASAYWAGHVEQHRQDRGGFAVWMQRAALERDTFYGRIARRALGPSVACLPGETIGNADVDALLATAPGRRAFALLQVGERRYAETELRGFWANTVQDGTFDRPLALVARATGFNQLAAEIEQVGEATQRSLAETAPPRLRPAGGFVVDPPLVYALVRHESNFQPVAVSRSGASGLMQLMPRTARAVAGEQSTRLHDPAVNLAIGQRYLLVLADDDVIDGNLIRMLAAYGQGQGGLRKWVDGVRDDVDPLMFLEAIPNAEIRQFVEDSLIYYWHYAAVMHVPAASLDALATGRYPQLIRAGEKMRPGDMANAGGCARPVATR